MDILPKTDFPDIRKNCMIESNHGNLLMLPREQKLARFYVPISDEHAKQGQLSVEQIDLEAIMERTKAILSPFTLESSYCNWWSTYKIGQRLAENFSIRNRIFLAGDAARTWSPCALFCVLRCIFPMSTDLAFRHTLAQSWSGHEHEHARQ